MISIIAELGSNPVDYNWNTFRFCKAASRAGATAVKIQIYKAEHFPEPYQAEKRRLAFPRHLVTEFASNARQWGLKAGASVFDEDAVEICARELDFLKLAAREQNNDELVEQTRIASSIHNTPVYRSISRIDKKLYWKMIRLWAIQDYPASMTKSLLTVFTARRYFNRLGVSWGWSSHTTGTLDCILAAWLGASVIEKHIALSRTDIEGGHSLLPARFARMVEGIRKVER